MLWPRCTSGPAACSPIRRRTEPSAAAPHLVRRWRAARPATRRATVWAAPTGKSGRQPGAGHRAGTPSLTAGATRPPSAIGQQIVQLLASGVTDASPASGPMAEVVFQGTQYLNPPICRPAAYLQRLPQHERPPPAPMIAHPADGQRRKIYEQHCASCHGERGEGVPAPTRRWPTTAPSPCPTPETCGSCCSAVSTPATAARLRPWHAAVRPDPERRRIAALLSYLRGAWEHGASEVAPLDVVRMRHDSQTGLP